MGQESDGNINNESSLSGENQVRNAEEGNLDLTVPKNSGSTPKLKIYIISILVCILFLVVAYIYFFQPKILSGVINKPTTAHDINPGAYHLLFTSQSEVYSTDLRGENKKVLYTRNVPRDIAYGVIANGTNDSPLLSSDKKLIAVQDGSAKPFVMAIINLETTTVTEIPLENLCREENNQHVQMRRVRWGNTNQKLIFQCDSNRIDILDINTKKITPVQYNFKETIKPCIMGQLNSGEYVFSQVCDYLYSGDGGYGLFKMPESGGELISEFNTELPVYLSPYADIAIFAEKYSADAELFLYDLETKSKIRSLGISLGATQSNVGIQWFEGVLQILNEDKFVICAPAYNIDIEQEERSIDGGYSPALEYSISSGSEKKLENYEYYYILKDILGGNSLRINLVDNDTYFVGWLKGE